MTLPIFFRRITVLAVSFLLLVCTAFADDTGVSSSSAVQDDSQCEVLFTPDDPRLFNFVKTRRTVDFEIWRGRHIRSIEYITLPIFNEQDPSENNWLYRGVNWLHVPTRKGPLRRQVLLNKGDALDPERVSESERILREANYLYDAMILPATLCDDSIDLLVVVRDVWTLQLKGSFSSKGGDDSRSLGITENNLLGHGHGIYLSYDADPERKGIAVGFQSAHVIDGHTALNVEHGENDDGTTNTFELMRPFYTIDTPWSGGISYRSNNLQEKIKVANVTLNEYDHHTENSTLFGGLLVGRHKNRVFRVLAGMTSLRNSYSDQEVEFIGEPLPRDRTLAYTWIGLETVDYDYWTTTNLNQLFRNEDINLGLNLNLRLGVSSGTLGSTERGQVASFSATKAVSVGDHHHWFNRVSSSLFYSQDRHRLEHSRWEAGSTYDHYIDDRNRWHLDMIYQAGIRLDPEETYTTGGTVLRGFENGTQRGDRFARINIERRHFYNYHPFHLFRVGSAIFLEAGRAWDRDRRFVQSRSVLYDLGIGLRVSSSKSRPGNVLHLNIAVPLNERDITDSYLVSFFATTTF